MGVGSVSFINSSLSVCVWRRSLFFFSKQSSVASQQRLPQIGNRLVVGGAVGERCTRRASCGEEESVGRRLWMTACRPHRLLLPTCYQNQNSLCSGKQWEELLNCNLSSGAGKLWSGSHGQHPVALWISCFNDTQECSMFRLFVCRERRQCRSPWHMHSLKWSAEGDSTGF